MKNMKIVVILSGIAALFLGLSAKRVGAATFHEKLGKHVTVDTQLFAADTRTNDSTVKA